MQRHNFCRHYKGVLKCTYIISMILHITYNTVMLEKMGLCLENKFLFLSYAS